MSDDCIRFQSYHWEVYTPSDQKKDNNSKIELLAHCLTTQSESYMIRIQGFRPYILCKIPEEYKDLEVNSLFLSFKKIIAPVSYKIVEKRNLYYDYDTKHTFVEFRFDSEIKRSKFNSYLDKKVYNFKGLNLLIECYEFDIKPVRQMLTEINLRYTEWFKITKFREPINKICTDDGIDYKTKEIVCDYTSIKVANDVGLVITRPLILSWDIETYSNKHNMMPNALFDKHVVMMISVIVQRLGMPETTKRFLLTHMTVKDFEGTEVYKFDNEILMIDGFLDLITFINPEIVMGYNIFFYDYPYIIKRFENDNKSFKVVGRLKTVTGEVKKIDWQSSAYGIQKLIYILMPGRIVVDMFTIIQREHKLDRYSLNEVSKYFLNETKHDVSPVDMFIAYENLRENECEETIEEMTRVAKYCIQDSVLTIKLFEKLNTWISMIELSSIAAVNVFDTFTGGQQKRCLSKIYNITRHIDIALTTRDCKAYKFKGGLVRDPIIGIHDYTMTLDFKSLYPSIMIAFNLCFTTLIHPDSLKDYSPEDYNIIECEIDASQVEESLNDDDESDDEDEEADFNDPDKIEAEGNEETEFKTKIVNYYFLKPHIRKGILPQIAQDAINERNKVRGDQKKYEEGCVEWLILEEKQKGLKVLANSLYGFTGTKKGRYRIPEVATSITAKGRCLIDMCRDFLRDTYDATIIYGDTDSVMFTIPTVKSNAEAMEMGERMGKEVSAIFGDPTLCTEFEKAGTILNIKKKKYMYWTIDKKTKKLSMKVEYKIFPDSKVDISEIIWDENNYRDQTVELEVEGTTYLVTRIVKPILMSKGVVTARRDNCKVQRDFFNVVTDMLIKRYTIVEVFEAINNYLNKMIKREIDHTKYIIAKRVGKKNYKQKNNSMRLFMQDLKLRGVNAEPGERLEYIIVNTGNRDHKLGQKMRSPKHFLEDGLPIDIEYYITNLMCKTIENLFQICYMKEIDQIEEEYRITKECRQFSTFVNLFEVVFEQQKKKTQDQLTKVLETIKDSDELDVIAKKLSNVRGMKGKIEEIWKLSKRNPVRYSISGTPISDFIRIVYQRKQIFKEVVYEHEKRNPKMKL